MRQRRYFGAAEQVFDAHIAQVRQGLFTAHQFGDVRNEPYADGETGQVVENVTAGLAVAAYRYQHLFDVVVAHQVGKLGRRIHIDAVDGALLQLFVVV